jgi:predicted nucleic acid-binding protein
VFSAVLDACVLYPFSLRDTLLRLAEAQLFVPLWSDRIVEEVRRNLIQKRGVAEEKANRLVGIMRAAFEEAEVDEREIARLEPAMTNDPDDRHVLAAAVASDSELVVTFNLRDFPAAACEEMGVEAIHPDEFLLDLFDLDPALVRAVVTRQAEDLTKPPVTLDGLLEMLETAGVPRFAAAVRGR